jgi:hypothetical protein
VTLADLISKYKLDDHKLTGWSKVSNDDLYALAEQGFLRSQVWAKEVERRCLEDLEWLAGYFTHETNPETAGTPIWMNMIRRENHGPILDLFVKKDKSKSIAEQSEIKNRLLLYPRGGMKSSIGLIDLVQWILNFSNPDCC